MKLCNLAIMQANLTDEYRYINPNSNNNRISNWNPVMVMHYYFLSKEFIPGMQGWLNHTEESRAK